MMDFFKELTPVQQALAGTLFTYGVTALGASLVFFFKSINKSVLNGMLGFASGVMIAASFWSLLAPAIALAEDLGQTAWLTAAIGFLSGGLFLLSVDKILPHLHSGLAPSQAEGIKTTWQRSILLVLAITLHNIPEGMAVGVSAGGGMADADSLAMGIALQDVPEGLVIALVLAGAGMSRIKAFLIGAASGLVEPVFAVLCAWLVSLAEVLLPLGLALAAGAMLLVVTHEVIPESRRNGHENLASLGLCLGFCLMMVMDTALG